MVWSGSNYHKSLEETIKKSEIDEYNNESFIADDCRWYIDVLDDGTAITYVAYRL